MNEIIHGDCLDELRKMADKSIDLVVTDPPYGRGRTVSKGAHGFGSTKGRKYPDAWDVMPSKEVFDEIRRVSKNQIIFGGNYFSHMLPPSNCWFVWDKKGSHNFKNPFADCELIWTSFNKVVKKYTYVQQGFIRESKDTIVHPTQKPSELMEQILADWSKPGDIILDPFLGSGTTAVAAQALALQFIGIEREAAYVAIAKARLKNAPPTQPTLIAVE